MIPGNFIYPLKRHGGWSGNRFLAMHTFGLILVLFSASVFGEKDKIETRPAALIWYEELAAQGDVDAKYNLGMMNEVGWSVPVDVKKAVRWYREAAKQGHAEAELRLGMLYYLGLGTRQSKLKGESWIRKAAKQDHGFAKSLNETLFKEDVPDTLDQKDVLRKVREIYLQDESKATSSLRRLVANAERKSVSQQQAKEKSTIRERRETRVVVAATNKEKSSSVNKAAVSKEVPQAKKKELERIESVVPEFVGKKSLKENRTLAQGNLATIRQQVKKGLPSAQYNLGRMYELGIKVPVDESKALALYKKSAEQGYANAQYRLAISMLYGKSAGRDETSGRKWLSEAASNGHQIAKNLLTNLASQKGNFSSGNSLAVGWYLERAIEGDAEAALNLGKIFENGWGASADLREAIKWYQHSYMLGSKDAEEVLKALQAKILQVQAQAKEKLTGQVTEQATEQPTEQATEKLTVNADEPEEYAVESFRPPDWVAYLAAFLLAVAIIFWPLFKRRMESGSEIVGGDIDAKRLTKQDPPFG